MVAEMDHLVSTLKGEGLCKAVHYKEMYIAQEVVEGEIFLLTGYLHKLPCIPVLKPFAFLGMWTALPPSMCMAVSAESQLLQQRLLRLGMRKAVPEVQHIALCPFQPVE